MCELTEGSGRLIAGIKKILKSKPGFLLRRDERFARGHYALDELDLKLERYVDFDRGFFIEAGANDGIAQSNTLYFERRRGWQGLLVEPVPELARRCRVARPSALTVNVALGAFEQRGTSVDMTYCNLMTTVDGALASAEEQSAHISAGAAVQNVKPYRFTVPCSPLSDVIDTYGIGRIDLLSLDVEGYEATVLKGVDFSRHRPRFILVEARYRDAIEGVISSHYEGVAELTERDVLYRARSDLELAHSVGRRYTIRRALTNAAALAAFYRS